MGISANPQQHKVTMNLSESARLVFVFNYPSEKQYTLFSKSRFEFKQKRGKQEFGDNTANVLLPLADELLTDLHGEELTASGWEQCTVDDSDGNPIDTTVDGWQSQVSPIYKLQAAGWIARLQEQEDDIVKNS